MANKVYDISNLISAFGAGMAFVGFLMCAKFHFHTLASIFFLFCIAYFYFALKRDK